MIASLALIALSACMGGKSPDPDPDAVDVPVRQIYDVSKDGIPAEGSYSHVRIENLDGDKVMEKRFPLDGQKLSELRFLSTMTLRLDPGSYRLAIFQRYCDGSCDNLGRPEDECSREIVVVRDRPLRATIAVRPGEGCTVTIGWSNP